MLRHTVPLFLLLAPAALDAQAGASSSPRSIAVDERLAADAGVRLGDRVVLSTAPGGAGDTVVVSAFTKRSADPAEVARADYRVRLHLDHLQALTG